MSLKDAISSPRELEEAPARSGPFVIEKGIPVPKGWDRFPFADMEIGDRFLVPEEQINRAQKAMAYYKRTNIDFNYQSKKTSKGLRIWRIPPVEKKD